MLILCREQEAAYNTDHIFEYYINEDTNNCEFDLVCRTNASNDISFYMATYSKKTNAYDSLCDLLYNIEEGNKVYILKEDYDYAELCDESSLSGSNQTR